MPSEKSNNRYAVTLTATVVRTYEVEGPSPELAADAARTEWAGGAQANNGCVVLDFDGDDREDITVYAVEDLTSGTGELYFFHDGELAPPKQEDDDVRG